MAAVSTKPVVLTDSRTDAAEGAIDLRRVQLGKAPDGRLRAAITASEAFTAEDLVAEKGGPPGSICLRLYTVTTEIERSIPEHLACVTADAAGEKLRGSVLKERANDLPTRTGTVSVSRSSDTTIVLRFSQSSIGKPASVRFSAEATRPGCVRTSCVDAAPTPPKVGTFTLREPAATTNRP
ncbi:hypothetical protein GKE82_23005 [Conexibacter sp. W3-3-2]|uniref:Uncharacterized protein n=1 Tax=Paraconexibacter algicola TaxID=2133960 RepID=A0A2T4UF10_9ACTN|nr:MULTISPECIES: hypothetical protein [Solirubrobacterales]MTD47079.1 hypothetical protein [Conexibacter sp. W3-3-2]PTL56355.1 hypothetical protein C7Y72_15420 [Paraconexibacter algicola]